MTERVQQCFDIGYNPIKQRQCEVLCVCVSVCLYLCVCVCAHMFAMHHFTFVHLVLQCKVLSGITRKFTVYYKSGNWYLISFCLRVWNIPHDPGNGLPGLGFRSDSISGGGDLVSVLVTLPFHDPLPSRCECHLLCELWALCVT